MKKDKTFILPCQCAGGYKTCGYLRIDDIGGDEFEIGWIKRKNQKRTKQAIYIFGSGLEKLRKFLGVREL